MALWILWEWSAFPCITKSISKPKTPWVWKSNDRELKKAMLKKMWNQKRQPRPPAVDGIQIFAIQETKNNVLWNGHHYQKLNSINSRRPWPPFWFHIFLSLAFFYFLTTTFLHPECFWLEFHFFYRNLPNWGYMVHYIIECSIRVYRSVLQNLSHPHLLEIVPNLKEM